MSLRLIGPTLKPRKRLAVTSSKPFKNPNKFSHEIGMRFGMLTVLALVGRADKDRVYLCRCDCGNETTGGRRDLRNGGKLCCGCRMPGQTHGLSDSPAYASWKSLKQRCLNPRSPSYPRYGGRGIKVCERWNKFENFIADMGERPASTSIDRIDVNGNYEPSNCRWADAKTQNSNKRPRQKKKAPATRIADAAQRSGLEPSKPKETRHDNHTDTAD